LKNNPERKAGREDLEFYRMAKPKHKKNRRGMQYPPAYFGEEKSKHFASCSITSPAAANSHRMRKLH